MDIALVYESVLPARGGCEHYIASLAKYLVRDGHAVHLYACRWDSGALPRTMHFHRLPTPTGPRFVRPWRFGRTVEEAMARRRHDVSMGFDKTWGQDILYPQGGLHIASADYNLHKHPPGLKRLVAGILREIDPAKRSFALLETKQYLGDKQPRIVVNSEMVRRHFEHYYDIPADRVSVLHAAIDPERFDAPDRFKRRAEERANWSVADSTPCGVFLAMNYRLKGLEPLLRSLVYLPENQPFTLAVVGSPKTGPWEQLARGLGVSHRVRFLGFRPDPQNAMFAGDFLIHPTFYDPCSLVVLEALACGLPVITTTSNGASELFTDGREGILIDDPHKHRHLAAAISKMCDPAFRSPAGPLARQAAQRWTFGDHYAKLLRLFGEVAERRAAA